MFALVVSAVLLAEPSPPPLVPLVEEPPPLVLANPPAKKETHHRRRVILLASGAAVFGLSYGLSAMVAATVEGNKRFPGQVTQVWPLFIPLGGPIGTIFTANTKDPALAAFMVLDALTQLGGVVLFTLGLALPESGQSGPPPAKPAAWLVPSVGPGVVGANFGLHF